MDWRTASSTSIGPGMSNAGWSGWLDIFPDSWEAKLIRRALGTSEITFDLSMDFGALTSVGSRGSNCLDINESLWRAWLATFDGGVPLLRRTTEAVLRYEIRVWPIGQRKFGVIREQDLTICEELLVGFRVQILLTCPQFGWNIPRAKYDLYYRYHVELATLSNKQ